MFRTYCGEGVSKTSEGRLTSRMVPRVILCYQILEGRCDIHRISSQGYSTGRQVSYSRNEWASGSPTWLPVRLISYVRLGQKSSCRKIRWSFYFVPAIRLSICNVSPVKGIAEIPLKSRRHVNHRNHIYQSIIPYLSLQLVLKQ